jgi:hypothetical protein
MAIIQRANVYFGAVVELITATTSFWNKRPYD